MLWHGTKNALYRISAEIALGGGRARKREGVEGNACLLGVKVSSLAVGKRLRFPHFIQRIPQASEAYDPLIVKRNAVRNQKR